jgi:hypothetical protein
MGRILRKNVPVADDVLEYAGADAEVSGLFPALVEFVTLIRWSATESRDTGTLLLTCHDGRFRLWLNDRDSRQSAWVSGESVIACLESAERGLIGGCLDWRADKPKSSRR